MIYFDPGASRDIIDGLRLLEGRLIGTDRKLSTGAREIRRIAERSLVLTGDHASTVADEDGHDDAMAELLDTPAAARFLNVSPSTVRRLRADGTLAAVRIGRAVRFRITELRRYIDGAAA